MNLNFANRICQNNLKYQNSKEIKNKQQCDEQNIYSYLNYVSYLQ